jgi:putative chitinase
MGAPYLVTSAQLLKLNSTIKNSLDLAQAINTVAAEFQIDQNPRRVRYFVAQSFFETLSYTAWSENLFYKTPERLVEVWPSRFTLDQSDTSKAYAPNYTANPAKLANLVYANRDGNGNSSSGDGWTFRGRGAFHLTGRTNYQEYDDQVYKDGHVVANPDLVMQPLDAFKSAGWFWNKHNLNALADTDQFTAVTKIINGSTDTVPQRLPVLNKVNSTLTWA